jgi:putative ABC transport system substrate-binding protein
VTRRKLIALLASTAAVAWPGEVRAQQTGKLPTIGLLVPGTPTSHGQWFAALVQRLRELGWIEGRTIAIEYRWAEGRTERAAEIAAEFAKLNADVIVTGATTPTLAVKEATSAIPVVFAAASDPVGSGLVTSLARPGGNVTGISLQFTDLAGKRLELLREAIPGLRRLAILANASSPAAVLEVAEVQSMASTFGLEVVAPEIGTSEDFGPAFDTIKGRAEAVYVVADPVVILNRVRISTLATAARLPTLHGTREPVEAGGLMSYGANFPALFRRAAELVDKILHGTKPDEIPVEQPTKFDLVINVTTAKALGLTVPPTLLARADEVIE